ncbi:RHS repeat-associated protein [Epilithonimonas hungarica]|nr:RHS repeat-associated protein [Epilithonimonas hungarica]
MNHINITAKTGHTVYNPSVSYENWKYNGKELEETGMYDYGARFYMPDIGRWGQHDPLSEITIDPFGYVYNNPLSYNDPTGMEGEEVSSDSGGGGGPGGGGSYEPDKGNGPNDKWHAMGYDYFFGRDSNSGGNGGEGGANNSAGILQGGGGGPGKKNSSSAPTLKPASAYDYSKEIIPGKMSDDWNYILKGDKGNPFSRFGDVLVRDWGQADTETRIDVVTAVVPFGRIARVGKSGYNMTSTAVRSALASRVGKRGFTEVGYQFSKHAGRAANGALWRTAMSAGTKNPAAFNEAGYKTFKEIWKAPGSFKKVGGFLEKRLPDGRGIRLQENWQFKGFLD